MTDLPGPKSREWLRRFQAVAPHSVLRDSTSDPTLTAFDGTTLLEGVGTVSIDHFRSGEEKAVEEQSQQADVADPARFGYKQKLRLAQTIEERMQAERPRKGHGDLLARGVHADQARHGLP